MHAAHGSHFELFGELCPSGERQCLLLLHLRGCVGWQYDMLHGHTSTQTLGNPSQLFLDREVILAILCLLPDDILDLFDGFLILLTVVCILSYLELVHLVCFEQCVVNVRLGDLACNFASRRKLSLLHNAFFSLFLLSLSLLFFII